MILSGARKLWPLLLAAAALGCAGPQAHYTPLPQNVKRIALHLIVNKTQQSGLEDALMARTRDEFLRDGTYALVPEKDADAVVWVTLTRYLVTPIQYDSNLAPTAYKMRVTAEVELRDKQNHEQVLRADKNLESLQIYSASNLAGGMADAQAQTQIWDLLARDIVQTITK